MCSYGLNEEWNLWYHSINEDNWQKGSYQKLLSLKTLFDYQLIKTTFKQNHYQNGMFFCMKETIFPNWEDPLNRQGGCLSFKVSSKDILSEWNHILFNCINQVILKENNEEVNGISISPKKEFNIIKIWFIRNTPEKYRQLFNISRPLLSIENSVFRKHTI